MALTHRQLKAAKEGGLALQVSTHSDEWGRIASRATVSELRPLHSNYVLLDVESVKAGVLVPKRDVSFPILPGF